MMVNCNKEEKKATATPVSLGNGLEEWQATTRSLVDIWVMDLASVSEE